MTYFGAAIFIAIIQIVHFYVLGSVWNMTGGFVFVPAWIAEAIRIDATKWAMYANEGAIEAITTGPLVHGDSVRNLGILFGALVSVLFATRFKWKKIKSLKQVIAAVSGGLLMGYGARIASGCPLGAWVNSGATLSLSAWVYLIFLFAGSFVGVKLLEKFFV